MKFFSLPSHFILLCILSSAPILLSSCFTIIDARADAAHDAMAAQVMERIHLGMDIDEAIAVLEKDGFLVDGKFKMEDWHYDHQTMYRAYVDLDGSRRIPYPVECNFQICAGDTLPPETLAAYNRVTGWKKHHDKP